MILIGGAPDEIGIENLIWKVGIGEEWEEGYYLNLIIDAAVVGVD